MNRRIFFYKLWANINRNWNTLARYIPVNMRCRTRGTDGHLSNLMSGQFLWQTITCLASGAKFNMFPWITGLHQKRVYTSLGPTYVHQSPWQCRENIRWYYSQLWCTHWGQEEPKLVYTLFCCKLVEYWDRASFSLSVYCIDFPKLKKTKHKKCITYICYMSFL